MHAHTPPTACITCDSNEYETRECTDANDRQCKACTVCSVTPGYAGTYAQTNCTATNDTVCKGTCPKISVFFGLSNFIKKP